MLNYKPQPDDHVATYATAFMMANLVFVGLFYIALWVLYWRHRKEASPMVCCHLKQSLIASSISTFIFLSINLLIILTTGYQSLGGLLGLELYFMLIVPGFLIVGIIAFTYAVRKEPYHFPVIRRLVRC